MGCLDLCRVTCERKIIMKQTITATTATTTPDVSFEWRDHGHLQWSYRVLVCGRDIRLGKVRYDPVRENWRYHYYLGDMVWCGISACRADAMAAVERLAREKSL
jgi:hypothetical protein